MHIFTMSGKKFQMFFWRNRNGIPALAAGRIVFDPKNLLDMPTLRVKNTFV